MNLSPKNQNIENNASLSGYITDQNMNPISEAKVSISCGENIYICYSSETGYYYKENLPLVFCIWNISAFKPGYRITYVEMPIGENTKCDFVLKSLYTIYVDDDNTLGPWDGSIEHPYRYIQDGIDNSSDGDTIFVYSGLYANMVPTHHACVYINKPITLIGENKHTTIIDGSFLYTVIGIMADNVVVHGFTVQHSGYYAASPSPSGISVNPPSAGLLENILVYDMIIFDNYVGLRVVSSANSSFRDNVISQNKRGCSIRDNEYNCSFYHNDIYDNEEVGIEMVFGVSWIAYNNIRKNGYGVYASDSESKIQCNNFIGNQVNAWYQIDMQLLDLWRVLGGNQWDANYWDNWEYALPKSIVGKISLYMFIIIPPFNPLVIPLGIYLSIRFDWHPSKEPYDIPIPEVQ
jgi:parallel beta-helix repeat protein